VYALCEASIKLQKVENKIVDQTNFVVSMELEDLNMKKNLLSSLINVNYMDTK
jgi:hypothetical protein